MAVLKLNNRTFEFIATESCGSNISVFKIVNAIKIGRVIMPKAVITAVKVAVIAVLVLGIYETMTLPVPPHLEHGGNWQFLTNLSLIATTVYVVLDVIQFNSTFLIYFHHLCGNLEFVVTVTYWTLIILFPEMLNSDSFDVSLLLDLKIHFLPYLVLLLFYRKPLISFGQSFLLSVVSMLGYWAWIEYLVHTDPQLRYPYPFLNGLGLADRLVWFVSLIARSTICLLYTSRCV